MQRAPIPALIGVLAETTRVPGQPRTDSCRRGLRSQVGGCLRQHVDDVGHEGAPGFEVEPVLGLSPQHHIRFGQDGAGAHPDRECRKSEVERTAGVEAVDRRLA